MKILFTHRYYWPDSPPYGVMLRGLATHVAEAGHEVSVYTSVPSYRGKSNSKFERRVRENGVNVYRCRVIGSERSNIVIRCVNSIIYCIGLFIFIARDKPNVVTAATFPPVFAAWVASKAARLIGARFIYHMQDIHPEVSTISGGVLGSGVIKKILIWFDNQTLKSASSVVVLSEDMANTIKRRGIENVTVDIINNPPLELDYSGLSAPKEYEKEKGKVRVIFAGNLGRFQNLSLLASGVAECFRSHPELELVFLGDGEAGESLKSDWVHHEQVKFFPFLPFSQASALIRDADVGLVSLEPDIYQVSLPSKVSTYLNLGLPLLVIVEPSSELAINTQRYNLGVVPKSMVKSDIAVALETLLCELQLSDYSVGWISENWSINASRNAWIKLLKTTDDMCCDPVLNEQK